MKKHLRVPAHCSRGHELTARTTHVDTRTADGRTYPTGWECVTCLRVACYRAHYGPDAELPAEELERFIRQANSARAPWTKRISFASGWGYDRPDPTPEIRAELEAAEAARIARELDELELKDARLRREQRARDAEASTAAIRAAMSAARGGVAV